SFLIRHAYCYLVSLRQLGDGSASFVRSSLELPATMQKKPTIRLGQALRFRSCRVQTVVQVSYSGRVPSNGWIRFIAEYGLILESECLLEKGTELLLCIAPTPTREGIQVPVYVGEVNCLRNGKWGLSCRFNEKLSIAEIQALRKIGK